MVGFAHFVYFFGSNVDKILTKTFKPTVGLIILFIFGVKHGQNQPLGLKF